MMSHAFSTPTPAMMECWDRGEAISQADLDALEVFFAAMVAGCEALGPRYSLATMALRMEYDRATRIQGYRRMAA